MYISSVDIIIDMSKSESTDLVISLYGSLTSYFADARIKLTAPKNLTVKELRKFLALKAGEGSLSLAKKDSAEFIKIVEQSVFAREDKIFHDDEIVSEEEKISLLPPVCGG